MLRNPAPFPLPLLGHQARERRGHRCDVPFGEIVRSLTWIANQTRPDIENAVQAIARFSHDTKPIRNKAAHKMLEYLNARSDLGLPSRRDSDFGSVQMECDYKTYVDADYAHKAEDR